MPNSKGYWVDKPKNKLLRCFSWSVAKETTLKKGWEGNKNRIDLRMRSITKEFGCKNEVLKFVRMRDKGWPNIPTTTKKTLIKQV